MSTSRSTKTLIILMTLLMPACSSPAPPVASAGTGSRVEIVSRSAVAKGWATLSVRLRFPLRTKAGAKTMADVDHFTVNLINVSTGEITASGQVASQDVQFTQVPDGSYQMTVDAVDATGTSVIEGGEQWSINQVTVASPNVTYSDGSDSLIVNLTLLGATGENVATTVNVQEGSTWAGTARVGCAPPTDGTWLGVSTMPGNFYAIAGTDVAGFAGDAGAARAAALQNPLGITLDAANNPILADTANARIRMVASASCSNYGISMAANSIHTIAGGGTGTSNDILPREASFGSPRAVISDPDGNLYVADAARNLVYLVTRKAGTYFGMDLYANRFWQVVGGGTEWDGAAVYRANLSNPSGLALDAERNLYIADTGNHRIRFVPRADGTYFGQPMAADRIYTIAGSGAPGAAADTGSARSATLSSPQAVALDAQGNVYIADTGNHVVRVLPKQDGTYFGKAMAATGLYTIAGNGQPTFADTEVATAGGLNEPAGLAVDYQGNVLIADAANHRVRFVPVTSGNYFMQSMAGAGLYTIAGNGVAGHYGDNGPALGSMLNRPTGVAVDRNGNAYVASSASNRAVMLMRGNPPIAILK